MTLEGAHDFSAHPLVPPGCELTVHQTIDQMTLWGLNGIKGWYLGPSCKHYCCHKHKTVALISSRSSNPSSKRSDSSITTTQTRSPVCTY
eukprot:12559004-Ditylum_brightwellii.AAC.1